MCVSSLSLCILSTLARPLCVHAAPLPLSLSPFSSSHFFAVKLGGAARKIRKLALPQEIAGNSVLLPNKRLGYEKDIRCSTGTFRVPVFRSLTCVVRRGRQWRRGRGRKRRRKPRQPRNGRLRASLRPSLATWLCNSSAGQPWGGIPVRSALSKRVFLSSVSRQKEEISPFLKTQQTLMAIWKTAKNVLSLCREKRGNAPCVSPFYRNADYQQFTDPGSVHPRATGCTCTSYCPYPRRDKAGLSPGEAHSRA